MNLIRRLVRALSRGSEWRYKEYLVGPHKILLPPNHALDRYQRNFPRYDVALGEIARSISNKYPCYTAIDIGANIGDSAALICKYQNVPTLCIEGKKDFIALLRKNASRIGNHISIEPCFVGPDGMIVKPEKIEEKHGTASIVHAVETANSDNGTRMKSLKTILATHARFAQSKLLKIDTDGYDFFIIENSLGIIREMKPVIFFEYLPSLSKDGEQESLGAIRDLMKIGYDNYIVYDNFGNYLIATSSMGQFIDLNACLRSNEKNKQIIYYFDICAFNVDDRDLFETVRENERSI